MGSLVRGRAVLARGSPWPGTAPATPPGHPGAFVTATLGWAFPAELFPAGSAPHCSCSHKSTGNSSTNPAPATPAGAVRIQVIPTWMSLSLSMEHLTGLEFSKEEEAAPLPQGRSMRMSSLEGAVPSPWNSPVRPRNGSNSSRSCKPQNTQINTQFNSASGISPAANVYGFAAVHTMQSHISTASSCCCCWWMDPSPGFPRGPADPPVGAAGTNILLEVPVGSLADPKLLLWFSTVFPLLTPKFQESQGMFSQ